MTDQNFHIEFLAWDSDFFKIRVGLLRLENEYNEANLNRFLSEVKTAYDLVYIILDTNSLLPAALVKYHLIQLVDEKTTFSQSKAQFHFQERDKAIKSYKASYPTDQMFSLAILAGKYSRFSQDEKIPREKFEELYRLWMINSLNKAFANDVFVFEEGGAVLGLVTWKIVDEVGQIGLIAVDENNAGRQIGQRLVNAVLIEASLKDCKDLRVVTQGTNTVARNFYLKCGFEKKHSQLIYHFWPS